MIKVEILVGIPASGKSTYAKETIAKDPDNWVRINNDDLRAMMNNSVWSKNYEKMIADTRNFLIRNALNRGKNIIIDNLNINKQHFKDVCNIAKTINADIHIYEKTFYIELEEALERNAKREGIARLPDNIIKTWWNKSGRQQFKSYEPRQEIFKEQPINQVKPPAWNSNLPTAIICDLDGTLALIGDRSPYNARDCDIIDNPNWPVIKTVMAHYQDGCEIIFCSGREDKYKEETIRFIDKYCVFDGFPIAYELYMRKSQDFRKDAVIKEEIYQEHIEGKFNVLLVLDDRGTVVSYWRSKGLTCFQVAEGNF